MFFKYRLIPIYFTFLIFSLSFLVSCAGNEEARLLTLSPTFVQTSAEKGADVGVTKTVEPTSDILKLTNTPEPTETIESTPKSEVPDIATDVPAIQKDAQDNAVDNPGESEETQPSPSPSPQEDDAVFVECLEKAAFFLDVTVPDETFFNQGESFTKVWRFRNEGTCTWTTDYAIVFHSGDNMSAPIEVSFPEIVQPGELVDLSVDMKAPTRGGQHRSNWEFKNPSGNHFGAGSTGKDLFWVLISVRFLDQNDEPQPDPSKLPPPSSPVGCDITRDQGYESQVVTLINQARSQNGLGSLNTRNELTSSALTHSSDMACNDFVGHSGSDGSHWTDRIKVQGFSPGYATENIYVGFPDFGGTPAGAFDWWMNSQVHRENILDPKVMEIGVGYVFNEQSSYGGYYTINFAGP